MPIPKLEDCKLGMRASGWNVIVVPEPIEEKVGSVFIPESARDKDAVVQQRARLVSVGPAAFDAADFKGQEPREGDAVLIAKLAGVAIKLKDGTMARVIQDKDVIAVLEEEAA